MSTQKIILIPTTIIDICLITCENVACNLHWVVRGSCRLLRRKWYASRYRARRNPRPHTLPYSKYVESRFRVCIDTIGFVQTTRPYKRLTDLMLAWHFKTNSKIDKWQPHAVQFSDNFKFLQSLSTSQFSLWVSVRFFVTRVLESDSTEVQVSLQNG